MSVLIYQLFSTAELTMLKPQFLRSPKMQPQTDQLMDRPSDPTNHGKIPSLSGLSEPCVYRRPMDEWTDGCTDKVTDRQRPTDGRKDETTQRFVLSCLKTIGPSYKYSQIFKTIDIFTNIQILTFPNHP